MLRSCKSLVFGKRHLGAEKEIGEGPAVQDAVNHHKILLNLEIKSMILGAEAIQDPAIALDFTETISLEIRQILLADLKLFQQLKLLQSPQAGKLGSADFIKHNLEHPHSLGSR